MCSIILFLLSLPPSVSLAKETFSGSLWWERERWRKNNIFNVKTHFTVKSFFIGLRRITMATASVFTFPFSLLPSYLKRQKLSFMTFAHNFLQLFGGLFFFTISMLCYFFFLFLVQGGEWMEGGIKKFSVCVDIAFVSSLIRTNKRDFLFCLIPTFVLYLSIRVQVIYFHTPRL